MQKVVINKCFGGFSISPEAALWLFERGFNEEGFKTSVKEYWDDDKDKEYSPDSCLGFKNRLDRWRSYLKNREKSSFLTYFTPDEKYVLDARPSNRSHPLLVECIETLGEYANGAHAELKVVEIPDGVEYTIEEYDGSEHVAEMHRTWY